MYPKLYKHWHMLTRLKNYIAPTNWIETLVRITCMWQPILPRQTGEETHSSRIIYLNGQNRIARTKHRLLFLCLPTGISEQKVKWERSSNFQLISTSGGPLLVSSFFYSRDSGSSTKSRKLSSGTFPTDRTFWITWWCTGTLALSAAKIR